MKKHLHIILFVTLALEVAVKVRASMAQSEARGGGRQCGSVERGGEMISLAMDPG